MGKAVFTFAGGAALLALLGEGLAAGLLWSQGRLNADSIREIRVILSDPAELTEPDVEDVVDARAIRILHLEEREQEQEMLRQLVADSRSAVLTAQDDLKNAREEFRTRREEIQKKESTAAVEKARAVLLKAQPQTAVEQLMELDLADNVLLMREMPDKDIARLLEIFAEGDKEQVERGQQIFQAITRGTSSDADAIPDPEAL